MTGAWKGYPQLRQAEDTCPDASEASVNSHLLSLVSPCPSPVSDSLSNQTLTFPIVPTGGPLATSTLLYPLPKASQHKAFPPVA